MTSTEAATALLTAESIIFAGIAILVNEAPRPVDVNDGLVISLLGLIAGSATSTLAFSFILSLIYLYTAEFPDRFSLFDPYITLALAVGSLVVVGIFGVVFVSLLMWDMAKD